MIGANQNRCVLHKTEFFQLPDHASNMVIHITNCRIVIIKNNSQIIVLFNLLAVPLMLIIM
ncbi:hypothetical protein D3C85_1446140 [compost metagenome]